MFSDRRPNLGCAARLAPAPIFPGLWGNYLFLIQWEESREALVVFVGLVQPDPGEEIAHAEPLLEMIEGFSSVVLVRNSSWFVGELV